MALVDLEGRPILTQGQQAELMQRFDEGTAQAPEITQEEIDSLTLQLIQTAMSGAPPETPIQLPLFWVNRLVIEIRRSLAIRAALREKAESQALASATRDKTEAPLGAGLTADLLRNRASALDADAKR